MRIGAWPGTAHTALQTHEPQLRQSHRVATRPLSARRWTSQGSPFVSRNSLSDTTMANENALPVMRWQSVQWQA
jgi:hypothetical protein